MKPTKIDSHVSRGTLFGFIGIKPDGYIYSILIFLHMAKQIRTRATKLPSHSQLIPSKFFHHGELKIPTPVVNSLRISSLWPAPGAARKQIEVEFRPGKSNVRKKQIFNIGLQCQPRKGGHQYRIYLKTPDGGLEDLMRLVFRSTYVRHLEAVIRDSKGGNYDALSIDGFHEFVDIDFDLLNDRMIWTPWYLVEPKYTHLWDNLAEDARFYQLDPQLKKQKSTKSSDWKEFKLPNGKPNKPTKKEKNVIYFLIDDQSKDFYIGQGGAGGTDRIFQIRGKNITPTHYRYEVFSPNLDQKSLDAIEQWMIRSFAYCMVNKPTHRKSKRTHFPGFTTDDYTMTNRIIK